MQMGRARELGHGSDLAVCLDRKFGTGLSILSRFKPWEGARPCGLTGALRGAFCVLIPSGRSRNESAAIQPV